VREIPFPTPAYTDDPFASFVESVFGLFFVPGSGTGDWGRKPEMGDKGITQEI